MFALRKQNSEQTFAETKAERTRASGSKQLPGQNPLWQSLALHPAAIQTKLSVSKPDDPFEHEADRVADQVMRMPTPPSSASEVPHLQSGTFLLPSAAVASGKVQRKCDHCEEEEKVQRKEQTGDADARLTAPPIVHEELDSPGQPLDPAARSFMEPRLGHDLGKVRVHTDARAAESARAVNAVAYTVGHDVVFGSGHYAPRDSEGQRLIAHEVTHTLQQTASGNPSAPPQVQRYTEEERRAMAQGRVTGQANDLAMATQRHFQPGDIVFRMGSTTLAFLAGEPVTHGGIYIGNGVIHDVVGFGNRHVRVTNFFNPALGEAANSSTFRLVRFRGPQRDLILARLLGNISRRDFRMPTDAVPFNLFSSAGDYRTATCLEYAHAQFLYAIRQLSVDESVPLADRQSLRNTYFTGSAAEPNALIQPQQKNLLGNMVIPGSGGGGSGPFSSEPSRSPSAIGQEAAMIAAATVMGSDVDPTRFSNRSESQYLQHYPGGSGAWGTIMNLFLGMTHDEVVLRTFTYQSFVDSRQFFEDVTS
jgi:hypothetical protein